ncbi:protein-glutamine gamma-glutamyltransferase [Aquibacillus koreensis]|uniref:Protein-glutamine gamma-glutamyltransferase n=2 Tax=Aquibacillus koreensis TaxID=279446 RepID=A0A9X3WJH3_9BACI|nr:protein-glutamine gamma-glutamyltransferase [Aquibacillus koreensis]
MTDSWNLGSMERIIIEKMHNSPGLYSFPSMDAFLFDINVRKNMIESAEKMNQSQAVFTIFEYARCNPDYWYLTAQGGFQLHPNRKPSQAILDIFNNSFLYAFECATACVIIFYHALLHRIGEEKFNELFPQLYLYSWHTEPNLGLYTFYSDHYIPSDVVYIKNPDYNPSTPWFRGLNAVALTSGQFYSHGFGIKSHKEIIDILNQNRSPGSDRTAYVTNLVTRISSESISMTRTINNAFIPIVVHHNKSSISCKRYISYLQKMISS